MTGAYQPSPVAARAALADPVLRANMRNATETIRGKRARVVAELTVKQQRGVEAADRGLVVALQVGEAAAAVKRPRAQLRRRGGTVGHRLVIDARLPALAVAAVLVWKQAPFLVVVLTAAATAALLRAAGVM